MGWTTGREVQCGCGWEGTNTEVVGVVQMLTRPSAVGKGGKLMMLSSPQWVGFVCPICGADVTVQDIERGLRITVCDLRVPTGKVFDRYRDRKLRKDYYRTIVLNGDRDEDRRRC